MFVILNRRYIGYGDKMRFKFLDFSFIVGEVRFKMVGDEMGKLFVDYLCEFGDEISVYSRGCFFEGMLDEEIDVGFCFDGVFLVVDFRGYGRL